MEADGAHFTLETLETASARMEPLAKSARPMQPSIGSSSGRDDLEAFLDRVNCLYLADRLRKAGITNAEALDTMSRFRPDYRERIKADLDKKGPEVPIFDWLKIEVALDTRAASLQVDAM